MSCLATCKALPFANGTNCQTFVISTNSYIDRTELLTLHLPPDGLAWNLASVLCILLQMQFCDPFGNEQSVWHFLLSRSVDYISTVQIESFSILTAETCKDVMTYPHSSIIVFIIQSAFLRSLIPETELWTSSSGQIELSKVCMTTRSFFLHCEDGIKVENLIWNWKIPCYKYQETKLFICINGKKK